MSSTRNKRKRAETDSRSVGRPKSREQRDAAAPSGKKNEGTKATVNTKNSNASKTSSGTTKEVDSNAVATRQQQAIAKDASLKTRSVPIGDSSVPIANNHTTRQKGPLPPNNSSATKQLHSREIPSSSDPSKGGLAQETSRSERLKGLIAHRSSLRNRIRYCAAAARDRLRQEIGENSDANLDLAKLKSGDDNEVSLFMEMASSATIAAKRIRSENEANSDRRTSLSLRRGSSVGKRMNAALSSLAPGSSTTSQPPSNLSTVESNTKVALNEKEKQAVGSTRAEKTQIRPNLMVPQTLPASIGEVHRTSITNGCDNTIPISTQRRQSQQDKPNTKDAKLLDGENNDGKGSTSTKNSKYSDMQAASSRQSSSTDSNRLALPMHLKVVTESLPQNKLSGRNVFSSKTTIIRKQRDAIEARLNLYREQTRQKVLGLPAKNGSFQHRSLHRHKSSSLPHRKMTHWDALLQEMSWMATDFIEERKWKEAASRSISSAVITPSEIFPSATRLPCDENIKRLDAASRDTSKQSIQKSTHPGTGTGTENKLERVSTCTKLKEMTLQTYPASSLEEDEVTRKVGRNIALMITKLGSAVMDTVEKQEFHQKEFQNFDQQTNRNQRDVSRRKGRVSILRPQNSNSVSAGLRATLTGQKRFSFPEISGQIESLEKMKERRNRGLSKSDASKSASKSRLSKEQKDAIDHIVNLWNQPIVPGVALSGTPSCGKTHTVSFLMWKRRKQGPQLLLCPKNSMIKWKHEIERLGDVRVLIFGLSGTLSDHFSEGRAVLPNEGDIVVCEFELLDHVSGFFETSTNSFGTIAVDSRYPSSFYLSPGKATQTMLGGNNLRSFDGSAELLSTLWWDKLLDISLHSSADVLLIEHIAGSHMLQNHSNLSPRIKLELAASRAAFLIGPRFFICGGERIQRRVLSWARYHGKLEGKRKSAEAREALAKATACFTITLPSLGWSNEKMGWELRRCKMEGIQRSNYDDCCIQVRGALSCRLSELVERSYDALHSVSASLMLLREQCIHADTRGEQSNSRISMPTRITENPAQLDSALAISLIEGSAKLREMISILRFKCGVNIAEHLRTTCDPTEQKMEACTVTSRKVAILATLPIARKTVSLLLNALGIQHKQSKCSECPQELQSGTSAHAKACVSSSQCQQFLPYFNDMRSRGSSSQPLADIVVASPMCLSGWNEGLGMENADTVILLDEDWTGRGEFLLSMLLSRIQASNFHTRKRCDFIRLICEGTIEEKLYSTETHEYDFVELNQWPRDKSGFITFPETKSEAPRFYKAATKADVKEFPLLRMTRLRHELLSSTLLPSRTIPLEVRSASKIQFLPFAHNDGRNDNGEIRSELELIRVLCHQESVASAHYIFEPNVEERSTESSNKLRFLLSSYKAGVFRSIVTTRQQFFVCSYLQNLFASNIEHFESTLAEGLKTMHIISFDQPHPAAISAPHYSAGEKSTMSRKTLFGSFPMSNNRTSGKPMLHYTPRKQQDHQQEGSRQEGTKQGIRHELIEASRGSIVLQQPRNSYSNLYATVHCSSEACSGYEGFEPLLFFPPLLNGMKQRKEFKTCQASTPNFSKRRGAPVPPVDLPSSKRARQTDESPSIISHQGDDSKAILGSNSVSINSSTNIHRQTFTEHASSLPKPSTPPEISNRYTRSSDINVVTATPLCPADMATISQNTVVSRECQVFPLLDNSEVPENGLKQSSGVSASFLDSVILFVKKPRMQSKGGIGVSGYDSHIAKHSADMQMPTMTPFGAEKFTGKGGEDGEKRNKKKVNEKVPQRHFPNPSSVQSSHAGQAPTSQATDILKKLGHRHRLHDFFVSRSLSSGLSMFECVPYQAVVAQVEARVSKGLEKRELFLGGKRGIFTPPQQVEICVSEAKNGNQKHVRRETLGGRSTPAHKRDAPILLSIGSRGGFLSSFKGINAPSIQKQLLGVSLPMGVKVSQPREETQQSAWSHNANSLLCDMVNRYGQNWILIAKMMQQILRVEIDKNQFYRTNEILWWKSAKRCQSHWESICETSESQSIKWEVAHCERRLMSIGRDREHEELQGRPCRSLLHLRDSTVLVGTTCMMTAFDQPKVGNDPNQAADGETPRDGVQRAPQRNANQVFSSLITSNVQRRLMPIAIIGVGNGPKQNQTAHSHPSHLQSVQESVTAHWSDGRTELWPLQILDAAEKQYVAARTSASPKPGSHPHISSSTSPLPPRVHGHPYVRVPGNPTTLPHSALKSAPPPPRRSGPNNVGAPPHASIAPKKTTPHNGSARSSGKSNVRSK